MNHTPQVGRTALIAAGFTAEEAAAWATTALATTPTALLAEARAWRAAGIPAFDAIEWHGAGCQPHDSIDWWLQGFTPLQATFVTRTLNRARATNPDTAIEDITAWLTAGLSALDIVLCAANGYLSLDRARLAVRDMAANPTLRGDLTLRAALAGIDTRAIGLTC